MKDGERIIGITGMPGSGKSLFAKFGKEQGFISVTMGDVIRKKVKEEGKEPTPANCNEMMMRLRQTDGKDAVAIATVEEIERMTKKGYGKIIIDGIRSQDEVDLFNSKLGKTFAVVAIHAEPEVRFRRLKKRGRSDAPKTREEFNERDQIELDVGLGEAIVFATYIIQNNDEKDDFRGKSKEFFEYLMGEK